VTENEGNSEVSHTGERWSRGERNAKHTDLVHSSNRRRIFDQSLDSQCNFLF
jgi:hypothetical protein